MSRLYGPSAPAVLDDLYRQLAAIHARRADALTAMRKANLAGDDDAWDAAGEEHDRLSDELADLRSRIDELEDDREPRRFRAMYAAIRWGRKE